MHNHTRFSNRQYDKISKLAELCKLKKKNQLLTGIKRLHKLIKKTKFNNFSFDDILTNYIHIPYTCT